MKSRHMLTIALLTLGLVAITILVIETPFHSVHAEPAPSHPRVPAAPGDVALEFVSYLGGKSDGLAVQGDYAYTGFGRAFVVVDVSDPDHPTRVSYLLFPGPWDVADIEVSGSYAYVSISGYGLAVVDISDPLAPREVGVAGAGGLTVAVSDTLAYVGQGDDLLVVDIVSPTHPVEVGSITINGMDAIDVALDGRYAYVAGRGGGLRVVDVLTATAPSEVGSCTTDIGYATGVDVVDDIAYVSDAAIGDPYSTAMLRVVDVSTPSSPTVVGSEEVFLGANADAFGVRVIGDHAYVAGMAYIGGGEYGGVEVVDVSIPTAPDRVTNYVTPEIGATHDIVVADGHAFMTTLYSGEFFTVDVSDLGGLRESGRLKVPEDPTDVVAVGDTVYVFDWGLTSIDVSDPASPVLVDEFEVPPPIMSYGDIQIRDTYAYLANISADLWVVDISDPTDLDGVGSCETHGRDIALWGNTAYLPAEDLNIVNIANPTAPQQVGTAAVPGIAQRIDIAGDHAYVLSDGDLYVFDLTNPTAPQQVGFRDLPDLSNDIAVSGDYAYVVAYDENLLVIDVSDPTAPGAPVSRPITGKGKRLFVDGDTAYLATDYLDTGTYIYYAVISVVDISNPAAAYEVTTYRVAYDYAETVYTAGDYAYLIGQTTGLHVLRIVPLALGVTPQSMMVLAEAGGPDPDSEILEVARASGPITWTAAVSPTSATWLSVDPLTGTTPASITVSISVSGLVTDFSPYQAQIVVESEEPVEGSPQVVDVTLVVADEIRYLYLPLTMQGSP